MRRNAYGGRPAPHHACPRRTPSSSESAASRSRCLACCLAACVVGRNLTQKGRVVLNPRFRGPSLIRFADRTTIRRAPPHPTPSLLAPPSPAPPARSVQSRGSRARHLIRAVVTEGWAGRRFPIPDLNHHDPGNGKGCNRKHEHKVEKPRKTYVEWLNASRAECSLESSLDSSTGPLMEENVGREERDRENGHLASAPSSHLSRPP